MSDLFFLYFIPLCFLVPIGVLLTLFLISRRKKLKSSPGSKQGAAHTNPLLKSIADRLFEDMGLPSQEFRRELGVKYPDLAMAFRQSVNFGIIRYTKQHWDQEPDEALKPTLINRLICDYYGFIVPAAFTMDDMQAALSTYFKQKKILFKAQLAPSGADQRLIISHKDQVIFELPPQPAQAESLASALQGLSQHLDSTPERQVYLFRETPEEIGLIFTTPQEYQTQLSAASQLLASQPH